MIPSASSPISSSAAERIIPEEVTPRSLASPSSTPPGIVAPGSATATVWPASTFGAPQTIVRGSESPVSTVQTLSRSAFGCGSRVSTLPITKPLPLGGPIDPTRSTSVPVIASRTASSSAPIPGSQCSRSHGTGHSPPRQCSAHGEPDFDVRFALAQRNCSSIRTSLSKKRRRSGTPWRSIAIRSTPIPKAKPWTCSGS